MAFFFISHSSRDRGTAQELHSRLLGWGFSSAFLDVDPRDGLPVGTQWERRLYGEMRGAQALIFIGSAASVASRWCFAELTLARFTGKAIFPLWIDGDGPGPLLNEYQWCVASEGDHAYERLRRAIEDRFGPRAGFFWDRNRSPYPGLAAFEPEDAAMFFGRDRKVSEVLRHLEPSPSGSGGVAVLGPSGSGKSSLVRAGVVPRIRQASDRWAVVPPFTPGERPVAALARSLAAALQAGGQQVDRYDLYHRLRDDDREFTERLLDVASPNGAARRALVLVVDQAEELVTLSEPDERERFLGMLRTATRAGPGLHVLTTLRTEVLGTTLYEAELADLIDKTVLLGPLDRSLIAEVIEGPAQIAGLAFDPGLPARMVDDTRGGDALPLLAYVLRQLTESRAAEDGLITHQEYDDAGGVLGALEKRADAAAQQVGRTGRGEAVLPTLLRMVTLDLDGEPTRRPVRRTELDDTEAAVVDAFVESRLVTRDGDQVDIAHEALLRNWPPLNQAIAASRERLRIQTDLDRLARDWDDAGRGDAYLLRDERLQTVRAALVGTGGEQRLRGLGGEYYAASSALEHRAVQAARRGRRRVRIAVGTVIALLAGLVGFVAVQYGIARDQTAVADSRGLAAQALAISGGKPDVGMLLAVEAWRAADTIDARSAALAMLTRAEGIAGEFRSPTEGAISAVALSPAEPLLAVGGQDRTIRLWDLDTRTPRGVALTFRDDSGTGESEVEALEFSPDGSQVAAVYHDGRVVLWTLGDGAGPARPQHLDYDLVQRTRVFFSPDGRMLAATGLDGAIALWDTASGHPLRALDNGRGGLTETTLRFTGPDTLVAFTDGDILDDTSTGLLTRWTVDRPAADSALPVATSSVFTSTITADASRIVTLTVDALILWDALTGQEIVRTTVPDAAPDADLVVDPSGTRIAMQTDDGHIRLLDAASMLPSAAQPPSLPASSFAFDADGGQLVLGGFGLATLWDVEHPGTLRTSLGRPDVDPALDDFRDDLTPAVGTSRTDPSLLVAVSHGILRRWHLPAGRPERETAVGYPLGAASVGPDGRTVATADYDGLVTTIRPGEPETSTRFDAGYITSLGLSVDGGTLATSGEPYGGIQLWDARTGEQWGPSVRRDEAVVWALAFSPDGGILASAGYGQDIALWRVVADDERKHLEPLDPVRTLVGHTGAVNSLAFSPDGSRVVSGGSDNTVRLWDVANGNEIGEPLTAAARAQSVAFSPDGSTVAAVGGTSETQFLELWDVATGRKLGETLSRPAAPGALSFSGQTAFVGDGSTLATIDAFGEVSLWDRALWSADAAAVGERLCAAASRNLTRSEWRQFLPEAEYRATCTRWPAGE